MWGWDIGYGMWGGVWDVRCRGWICDVGYRVWDVRAGFGMF